MDLWFVRYVSKQTNRQTDRQTDKITAILCTPTRGDEVATKYMAASGVWHN